MSHRPADTKEKIPFITAWSSFTKLRGPFILENGKPVISVFTVQVAKCLCPRDLVVSTMITIVSWISEWIIPLSTTRKNVYISEPFVYMSIIYLFNAYRIAASSAAELIWIKFGWYVTFLRNTKLFLQTFAPYKHAMHLFFRRKQWASSKNKMFIYTQYTASSSMQNITTYIQILISITLVNKILPQGLSLLTFWMTYLPLWSESKCVKKLLCDQNKTNMVL